MMRWQEVADLARALGAAKQGTQQWQAIAQTTQSLFGHGLLTGLVYWRGLQLMRRIYTSDEQLSPLGGFKLTGRGPWTGLVLEQGLPYIGRDEADIRSVFSEADELIARGLQAVLNIPIWHGGEVIGSLNMLGPRGTYNAVDDALLRLLSGVCVPVFLAVREAGAAAAQGLDRAALQSV